MVKLNYVSIGTCLLEYVLNFLKPAVRESCCERINLGTISRLFCYLCSCKIRKALPY